MKIISCYGGTAKRYAAQEPASEPYKKGNAKYIDLLMGITVRWYSDAAHHMTYPFHRDVGITKTESEIFGWPTNRQYLPVLNLSLDIYADKNQSLYWKLHDIGFSYRNKKFIGLNTSEDFSEQSLFGYPIKYTDYETFISQKEKK